MNFLRFAFASPTCCHDPVDTRSTGIEAIDERNFFSMNKFCIKTKSAIWKSTELVARHWMEANFGAQDAKPNDKQAASRGIHVKKSFAIKAT
jgi:hypothetical protein